MTRRDFVNRTGTLMALGAIGLQSNSLCFAGNMKHSSNIRITDVDSNFQREPLFPYRYKGSAITESWQTAAWLKGESGLSTIGLGTQGILWSDSKVFAAHSESAGNALMYAMSERALQIMKGNSFTNPLQLLDDLLPEVYAYGKKITGNPDLRKTFVLNSLVCVDNAAWRLYARENNINSFSDLIPDAYKPGLSWRHEKVASMPSFGVGTKIETIKAAADEGYFIIKLKTGSPGTQKEMLAKDIEFMSAVHAAIGHYETPYTKVEKFHIISMPMNDMMKRIHFLVFWIMQKK